ncbi:MAG: hypothetical protein ACKVT1_16070 [Dehalococcoidia bacterium]
MRRQRGTVRFAVAACLLAAGVVLGAAAAFGAAGDAPDARRARAGATVDAAFAPAVSRDGTPEPPPPTATATPAPTSTPTPVPTPTPARPHSLEGLRVWSDGDSTSYFVTLALFDLVGRAGGTPVRAPDYKISSGLANRGNSAVLRDDYTDWPTYIVLEMGRYAPDVVVFMIGANDAGYAAGRPDDYRARVGAFMDLVQAPGRFVVWVGEPTMTRPDLAVNIPVVNAIYAEEAALRPWMIFVDASSVTADAGDGVHLSRAAGYAVATLVLEALVVPAPAVCETTPTGLVEAASDETLCR